jgi:hypothetical protein
MADFEEPEGPPDLTRLRKGLLGPKPLKPSSSPGEDDLPGERGRYLLWFGPPTVSGEPHWVHFSWLGQISFCLRDYIEDIEVRVEERNWKKGDPTALQMWRATPHRIQCNRRSPYGDLAVKYDNVDFWKNKLPGIPSPDEC